MNQLGSTVARGAALRFTLVGVIVGMLSLVAAVTSAVALPTAKVEEVRIKGAATTAAVEATLTPHGQTTSCAVEYSSEAEFGGSKYNDVVLCTPSSVSGVSSGTAVLADLTGLSANTKYHFRFKLENEAHEVAYTSDEAFMTFGIEAFSTELVGEALQPYTQAGGHPYEWVTSLTVGNTPFYTYKSPDGNLRDVIVHLPRGFVGDPSATPEKCTRWQSERFRCPASAQVGTLRLITSEIVGSPPKQEEFVKPLYNITPPEGVAAEFSARFNNFANAFIDAKVRTGEGYGVSAESLDITTLANVIGVVVKIWGVPGSPLHNSERYCREATLGEHYHEPPCPEGKQSLPEVPFVTAPTNCSEALSATVLADSYQSLPFEEKTVAVPAMTGCEKVGFKPTIAVTPESSSADSPTGVEVHLHMPQEESPAGVTEANLKNATVTLPQGVTVNPSAASGLVGCPLLKGNESHEGEAGIDLESAEPAKCPNASNIGTVSLETPLYPGSEYKFEGQVFLGQQGDAGAAFGSNPFGSLLAIYIAIDEPKTGVVVKLAGHVVLNEATGQLSTTFEENPQLPFENLTLKFNGGPRAALATPIDCGTYEVTSLLEPWSHQGAAGEGGTPNAEPFSRFAIASGAGGGACGAPGFAPTFDAGTADNQAGGFGSFSTILERKDGEQRLESTAITLPKGVAAILAGVPLCGEAQANAGACSSESQIGHVKAQVGVGTSPVTLPQAGGREDPVYLTGPYDGAPFGLAIVVHPEAGPFNLAKHAGTAQEVPVVIRAAIEVNPSTAQVSIVAKSLPTFLEGVPVDLRAVDVIVDRPDFTFNATSCEPMSVTGAIGSAEGASAAVSSRYQAAGCSSLAFKPGFSVSTHAGHTRRFGAYLHVAVTSGSGQANIKSVHVTLPRIMPARDETLHQACSEEQFAANPAGCPAGSYVGTATAHTPVLPVPLSGPAIFVSHGGAAFPDLDVVLQGDGVTVDLAGSTEIVDGITSSNFASVPDTPIDSFEMTLPTGRDSALSGTANFCVKRVAKRVKVRVHGKVVHRTRYVKQRRAMVMPTTITGQNGAVLTQQTPIVVQGCPPLGGSGSH